MRWNKNAGRRINDKNVEAYEKVHLPWDENQAVFVSRLKHCG